MEEEAARSALTRLYDLVTGDEDARVCKDIPPEACRDMPANFFVQLFSQLATKIGDELASAKLVLTWVVGSLGAPAFMTGFLVPIRESGALLPQLVVAGYIRRAAIRKWYWVAGSVLQGLSVAGMALAAMSASGALGGWLIVSLLTLFSLSRGVCSVTSKDVLGKTVSKTRRGTLAGYSAAAAGVCTVGIGLLARLPGERGNGFYAFLLLAAAALWLGAAALYSRVREPEGATEGGGSALAVALGSLALLRGDRALKRFILTRALLLSTALSFPYFVVLSREEGHGGAGMLGLLIVASGLAGSLSAPVWGRLADRSSRLVLTVAAASAGAVCIAVVCLSRWGGAIASTDLFYAAAFLAIGIAHSGVRIGRKTYLVDLATAETRAAYVALSNTIIGGLLLAGGAFGALAQLLGTQFVLLAFGGIAWVAAAAARTLREVQ